MKFSRRKMLQLAAGAAALPALSEHRTAADQRQRRASRVPLQ
jgi:hypothetical protein